MTKLAQLAHLSEKIPNQSSAFYRRVLGINAPTFRDYCARLARFRCSAVGAKFPNISATALVQHGE